MWQLLGMEFILYSSWKEKNSNHSPSKQCSIVSTGQVLCGVSKWRRFGCFLFECWIYTTHALYLLIITCIMYAFEGFISNKIGWHVIGGYNLQQQIEFWITFNHIYRLLHIDSIENKSFRDHLYATLMAYAFCCVPERILWISSVSINLCSW